MLIDILLAAEVLLSGAAFLGLCAVEAFPGERPRRGRHGRQEPRVPALLLWLGMAFGALMCFTFVAATTMIPR